MSVARIALLVVFGLLLAVVLIAGQAMILAQQTVLRTSFLLPHVERLFSTISTPDEHEEIVRYLVGDILRGSNVRGLPFDMRERLIKASVTAFSAQWIEGEILDVVNKVLAVLRGRSQELKHTIYLSRRKDVLLSEFARGLSAEDERQVRAGSSMVPDAVELTELVGAKTPATLKMLGQRYILFSLLFIYVVPGVLVLLSLQIGRVKWGIVAMGAGTLASGIAALVLLGTAYPGARDQLLARALSGLPSAFDWAPGFIRTFLADVVSSARKGAIAFAVVGASIAAVGALVVVLTRKKTTLET